MATTRQKKAIGKLVETRGNVSKAMREAGYDETTAKNPKNLTDSKAWEELMSDQLPDGMLIKKHKEGLNAKRNKEPDFAVRHKYLETAYKIKKKMPKEGTTIPIQINFNEEKENYQ